MVARIVPAKDQIELADDSKDEDKEEVDYAFLNM